MLFFLALSLLTSVCGMFVFARQEAKHRARLALLDVNIHVNGIRGKSTVTRMIGGMLRETGFRPIAKTTGSYACVIEVDGEEHPIKRSGPANIGEQYRFIREWFGNKADTEKADSAKSLVVECMAVKPKYQAICQDTILRSSITVLTNVRLDHQEELGETLEDIAESLCATIPWNGFVVTGERNPDLVKVIERRCEERNSRLIVAEESELTRKLAKKFDYRQYEENVAIAVEISKLLDLDPEEAVRGMLQAAPDPGTTKIARVRDENNREIYWIPMFAVNDRESTIKVFREVSREDLPNSRKVLILNNRADRTDRASLFVDVIAQDLLHEIDRIVLYGDIQEVVLSKLLAEGVDEELIVTTSDIAGETQSDARALLTRTCQGFGDDTVAVFGMANIHTSHVDIVREYVDDLAAGLVRSEAV